MTQAKADAGRAADSDWVAYESARPDIAGVYEWQIPSRTCADMTVRVLAHFRKRGAGYQDVLSPEFDHWDGYSVTVPKGTRWRMPEVAVELPKYRQELICVEGLEIEPCPFCKSLPKIKGVCRSNGGIVITGDAHTFNSWWFECCAWAKSPHYNDPRELEKARRAALSSSRSDQQ